MASLSSEGKKRWRIRFVDIANANSRKSIRIYGATRKQAEGVLRHVESIISARIQSLQLEPTDAAWLGSLPDEFYAKIANVGLAGPREVTPIEEQKPIVTIEQLLTEHLERGRTTKGRAASESTWKNWRAAKNHLLNYFDLERDITTIHHEDGYQFRVWLDAKRIKKTVAKPQGQPMAENAKRKNIESAKVFFNGAIRRGLITVNPFEHLPSSTEINRSRDYYLTIEAALQIREACPDAEWRLLFSLWRFAGLRKTEVMWLTWDDVLWDEGRMRVHAKKTRHHEGKEIRYVPLRDILDDLKAVFEERDEGATKMITRYSESNSNLDKPMKVILNRAGVAAWPKLFQNMRGSCETDWLNEGHPAHVVAGWIGHSVKIQRANYAQITDGHFDSFNSREGITTRKKGGAECGPEVDRTDRNTPERRGPRNGPFPCDNAKTLENAGFSRVNSTGGGT